jgi:hypothetical protein
MKNRLLLLAFVFVLSAAYAFAQEEFKVLATKGGNKHQPQGSGVWNPLLVGKKLLKGDKITLEENGYLGLAHKNGKTIELKKAGTYEVNKLAGEVSAQNASTTKKYVDYLAGEMGKGEEEDMAKNRYKYMAVTGSVERGTNEIALFAPSADKGVDILNHSVLLKWEPETNTKTYVVQITNLFGEVLHTEETNNNSLVLHLDNKNEKIYVVKVSSKENAEIFKELRVSYLSANKNADLNKQLKELKAQLGEENALNSLVLASFYEDHKLYLEAIQAYENAIRQEPEVDDYQIAYGLFLERAGIAKPVAKK